MSTYMLSKDICMALRGNDRFSIGRPWDNLLYNAYYSGCIKGGGKRYAGYVKATKTYYDVDSCALYICSRINDDAIRYSEVVEYLLDFANKFSLEQLSEADVMLQGLSDGPIHESPKRKRKAEVESDPKANDPKYAMTARVLNAILVTIAINPDNICMPKTITKTLTDIINKNEYTEDDADTVCKILKTYIFPKEGK